MRVGFLARSRNSFARILRHIKFADSAGTGLDLGKDGDVPDRLLVRGETYASIACDKGLERDRDRFSRGYSLRFLGVKLLI